VKWRCHHENKEFIDGGERREIGGNELRENAGEITFFVF
jgi:hypothetical protein